MAIIPWKENLQFWRHFEKWTGRMSAHVQAEACSTYEHLNYLPILLRDATIGVLRLDKAFVVGLI